MRNKYTWTTILSVLFVTIALFWGNLSAFALDIPSPPKNGYILDQTRTLTKEDVQKMNRMGFELQQKTKAQIAVLIIPT